MKLFVCPHPANVTVYSKVVSPDAKSWIHFGSFVPSAFTKTSGFAAVVKVK